MLVIVLGALFCGIALGYALGSLQRRTLPRIAKDVQERIEARLAAIVRPRKAKLRLVA